VGGLRLSPEWAHLVFLFRSLSRILTTLEKALVVFEGKIELWARSSALSLRELVFDIDDPTSGGEPLRLANSKVKERRKVLRFDNELELACQSIVRKSGRGNLTNKSPKLMETFGLT
jgi:hypothetical protein